MHLSLLFFAALRDLVDRGEDTFETQADELSVAQLCQKLMAAHPQLRLEGVRVAVNEEFVTPDHLLHDGDVVAFIPPVSGG